ncbi:Ubiquitin-conjugating enzyme/RWD-like protein [Pseudocohnilembus persalinus]|uniref:Ubiquitin-conjugating enzyme/RWD-like protein n=1 Tax=Pseudocohnilembus persalinus TaxID=266149 RepID=A0A0V0Q8H6_PSEPJ|nr:Ubiquitin-conjugating enzyme/RWD-like protein [Pseudocohnilembus persalinus]|eukprot:KRW98546.1 Ubiquitin-conjugating enzyme/RWD-like protein [Pseudocohnilembus persalinus]
MINLADNKRFEKIVNQQFQETGYRELFKLQCDKIKKLQSKYDNQFSANYQYNSSSKQFEFLLKFSKNYFFPQLKNIKVTNSQKYLINNTQQFDQFLLFQITVSQQYPIKGVRLYSKTFVKHPNISDGRDILQDVLTKKWNNITEIVEIIEKIPQFINLIYPKIQDLTLQKYFLKNQKIGRFYLGNNYLMTQIKELQGVIRIPCVQIEPGLFNTQNTVRIILLTDCHFVLFNAEEKDEEFCKCIFVADIQSISKIQRSREQPDLITLTWKNYFYNQNVIQELEVQNECERLIKIMLQRVQNFQSIKIQSNSYLNCGKNWKREKQNIYRIVKEINQYEQQIQHKFNQDNVQNLIILYNEAIEHYSAVGDYLYDIFRNKLQQLLRRKDVQILLSKNQICKNQIKILYISYLSLDFDNPQNPDQNQQQQQDYLQQQQQTKSLTNLSTTQSEQLNENNSFLSKKQKKYSEDLDAEKTNQFKENSIKQENQSTLTNITQENQTQENTIQQSQELTENSEKDRNQEEVEMIQRNFQSTDSEKDIKQQQNKD